MKFYIPILFLLFLLAPQGNLARAADPGALDFREWGLLAVQDGGRRKPMDTLARETVVRLTGQREITAFGRAWQPSDFMLSMLLDTHDWAKEPVLLVGYRPLAVKLGLDPARKQFSYMELAHATGLGPLVGEAHDVRDAGDKPDRLHQEAENVASRMALFDQVEKGDVFLLVPAPHDVKQAWVLPPDFGKYYAADQFAPATTALQSLAAAYMAGDAFQFSVHAHELRAALRTLAPAVYPSDADLGREYFYNQLRPFDWAALAYAVALVLLGVGAWFEVRSPWLNRLGIACAVTGLGFHLAGMGLRCWIGGRPPVTNMYESMIWVASGVLIFALVFFLRYRTVTYLLAALPISLSLLLLVGQMPLLLPENIDPLVPVLRNNYWLIIHVLTITLSYAAFALAMGFGHILLWQYVRQPLAARADHAMHFWLYRVLQLGVLLLAAGTILGGVWANYSWGRFWGWDPKETWALITLLCYIVVLHGKLAGWWGDFGLAVGSVVCFLAVVMAWYGVNFVLGTGLHSYGFGVGGESYVISAVGLDLLFVATAVTRYLRRAAKADALAPTKELVSQPAA
ncbi:MAG TPA: cytochrome c biogenesis protein CcsA [Candidatus Methylacidiphilales bacterium]|nr:cytochrome c biogenesis protein CcsA [Candidatus Methylacidiphilales bacterium]